MFACSVVSWSYIFSSFINPNFVNDVLIKVKIWWWVKSKCAWTERCNKIQNWAFDKQTKPKIASGLTVRISVLTRNTQIWKLGAPPSEGQQKSKYRWKMTIDSWQRSQFWQEWHKTKKTTNLRQPLKRAEICDDFCHLSGVNCTSNKYYLTRLSMKKLNCSYPIHPYHKVWKPILVCLQDSVPPTWWWQA